MYHLILIYHIKKTKIPLRKAPERDRAASGGTGSWDLFWLVVKAERDWFFTFRRPHLFKPDLPLKPAIQPTWQLPDFQKPVNVIEMVFGEISVEPKRQFFANLWNVIKLKLGAAGSIGLLNNHVHLWHCQFCSHIFPSRKPATGKRITNFLSKCSYNSDRNYNCNFLHIKSKSGAY